MVVRADRPRVVVGGGSPLVRSALTQTLSEVLETPVGEAADVSALLDACTRAGSPGVVVASTSIDGTPLVDLLPEVLSTGWAVLVVCGRSSLPRIPDLLVAGASGYVMLEDCTPADVAAAVRATGAGGVTLHPEVAHMVLTQWRSWRDGQRPTLTEKERAVLDYMTTGLTVRQVAREMGVSEKTVDSHRARIYDKLGVRSRAGAVARAVEWGLLAPAIEAPDVAHE